MSGIFSVKEQISLERNAEYKPYVNVQHTLQLKQFNATNKWYIQISFSQHLKRVILQEIAYQKL